MIRTAVIDDHPAVRAGLRTILEASGECALVAEADGADETVWPLLDAARPDIVLVDYHLPRHNGLLLCHRIKRASPPPKVLVYTAYASPQLAVPAMIAGADGLIGKGARAAELLAVIKVVMAGTRLIPRVAALTFDDVCADLVGDDRRLARMLVAGAAEDQVARHFRRTSADVSDRVRQILAAIPPALPAGTSEPITRPSGRRREEGPEVPPAGTSDD